MLIKITDVQRAGYCGLGARRWFEARGFNFRRFLKNGIESEELLATGDALAKRVVELREKQDG